MLTSRGDDSGRGQMLSTVDNDRHLFITLSVQLSVQRDGRDTTRGHRRLLMLEYDAYMYVLCQFGW